MHQVEYSRLCYYKIEPDDLDSVEPQPMELLGDGPWRAVGIGIDEPPCQLVYEDFFPDHEYRWTTWIDQVDFVMEGKAEITYYQPPSLEEKVTIIVKAPCVYLIPRGTPIVWRVLGNSVFRHISVDIPNPLFPTELAKSLKGKR